VRKLSMRKFLLYPLVFILMLAMTACGGSSNPPSSAPAPETKAPEAPAKTEEPKKEEKKEEGIYSKKKPVTIVAPSTPGSGWDLTARSLAQTFEKEKLVDFPIPVVNENGATGAVSLAQLVTQNKGDAFKISVTSTPIMSNYLRGDSKYGYQDVTMIARLMTEYFMIAVGKDSEYQTLKDLLDAVVKDPASVPIGASGDDRLPFALLVDKAGGDPSQINFVAYEGGGEISNAVLNGDIKAAVSGVSEFRGMLESGTFRGLAVMSENRLGGPVKDVPTAIEAGYDVSLGNWRGVMGPPDMPEEAVKFWQDTIEKAMTTPTWKEIAEKNQWEITFMKGEEFAKYLEKTQAEIKEGLVKTKQIQQ